MDNISLQLLPQDPWEEADNLTVSHLHWYSDAQLSCLVVLKQNYIVALQVSPQGCVKQKTHVGGITCLGLTGISRLDDSVGSLRELELLACELLADETRNQ